VVLPFSLGMPGIKALHVPFNKKKEKKKTSREFGSHLTLKKHLVHFVSTVNLEFVPCLLILHFG